MNHEDQNDENQIRRINPLTLSVLCSALFTSGAFAADDSWRFGVDLYLWGANIDIESSSGSNSEIRFTDVVEDMELAGMGSVKARRDKWEFALDTLYFDIDDNVDDSVGPGILLNDLGIEAWVITPTAGYRIQQSDRSELYLVGGARYLWIDVSEKFNFGPPLPSGTRQFSESAGSWDGIVGLRGQWHFTDKWYTAYYLDVGTGESDSTGRRQVG